MRSVNGWVRESSRGPPTTQHVPREERVVSLVGRGISDRVPSETGNTTSGSELERSKRCSRDHRTRRDSIFLTAMDAEDTPRGTVGGAQRRGREANVRVTRHSDGRRHCKNASSGNVKLWGADGRLIAACRKRGRRGLEATAHSGHTDLNLTTGRSRAGRGRAGSRTMLGSVSGRVGLARTWGSKSTGALHQRHPAGISRFTTHGAELVTTCSGQYSRRRVSLQDGANAGPALVERSKHQASESGLEEQDLQENWVENDRSHYDDPLRVQEVNQEITKVRVSIVLVTRVEYRVPSNGRIPLIRAHSIDGEREILQPYTVEKNLKSGISRV